MLKHFDSHARSAAVNIHDLITIARAAGKEIIDLRAQAIASSETKDDGSPVTVADKRAHEIVLAGLSTLPPYYPVISEESQEDENRAIQAAHSTYWVCDPLDGTRSYISGYGGFGVHIALIENGVPTVAAIYFPAEDTVYYTYGKNGAFRQIGGNAPEQLHVRDGASQENPPRVAVSWFPARQPELAHGIYIPHPAVGGGRVTQLAEGSADLALTEDPFSYWDIAAAHAVLRAAGGELYDLHNGEPIRYPQDKLDIPPALGGHPEVVAQYRAEFSDGVSKLALNKKKNGTAPAPAG